MHSIRFQRPVIVTHHARQRMNERGISETLLLEVIDGGDIRYADATHLWAYKALASRNDNLVCAVLVLESAIVVKTVMHHFEVLQGGVMRTTYYEDDDILVVHLSDKPIVREVSQDWNTHVSYAADGSTVELVLLDARANGAFPFELQHSRAA